VENEGVLPGLREQLAVPIFCEIAAESREKTGNPRRNTGSASYFSSNRMKIKK
jgi:hypothetical protein